MTLPSINVPVEQVKFRFGERYVSEATNAKFMGVPYGVYAGFLASASGNVITLSVDPDREFSFMRMLSSLDSGASVDVFTTSALTFDLSVYINAFNLGTPGVIFPLFIFATANYQFGSASSALVEFRTNPTASDTDLLLGQVFYTGSNLTVSATPLERSNPYAYSGAPLGYGFMTAGQANGLLDGLDITDEVTAARVDLAGTTHLSLSARMGEDFSASSMAGRLAKSIRVIQSNVHALVGPASSLNVSSSFTEVTRLLRPFVTIDGGGTETQVGAVTGPLDAIRNVVVIVDDTTKERPIDNDIDRIPVFGRLNYAETLVTGSYVCTATSAAVLGAGTFFLTEFQIGDLLLGGDGLYYVVGAITDDLNLTLTSSFGGITGPVVAGIRRRFTLLFRKVDGSTEVSAVLPAGDIQFFFGVFYGLDVPVFDASMVMHQGGEPVQIGNATDTVSGRVLIDSNADDTPVPLAGAIQTVKDSGFQVSQNTYDFNFSGASPGAPGVVNVTQRGATGNTGPAGVGAPGPVGPQGPDGIGFNGGTNFDSTAGDNHMWIKRAIVRHSLLGLNVTYFHTVSSNVYNIDEVLWATAGIWYVNDFGGGIRVEGENWRLTQVTRDTPTQVTLTAATEVTGFSGVDIGIALNIAGRT